MISILLVDDDKIFALNLQQLLEMKGFEVDVEINTQSAIDRLENSDYDFLITDLRFPGEGGGLEIINACRKKRPGTKIIAISGGGYIPASDYLRISKLFGADAILQKPFFIEDLLAEINRLKTEVSQ